MIAKPRSLNAGDRGFAMLFECIHFTWVSYM